MTVTTVLPGARQRAAGVRDRVRRGIAVARRTAAPAVAHLREFGYTMCGLAAFSVAGFIHSVFTGFLVLGASFLVLEWRVRGQ